MTTLSLAQTATYGALFLLSILLAKRAVSFSRRASLPPGPKGWPIIGNVLDMPQGKSWVEFARWGERWGGLIYLNLLGQSAIVVNDADTATALLDKKSLKYSDRPVLPVAGEIVGLVDGLGLLSYGSNYWREGRRMMHHLMGSRPSIEKFYDAEELETHRLMRRILEHPEPENLPKHIRLTAGAIIMMISHGYLVKEKDDYFVYLADRTLSIFAEATIPGRFLADTFFLLKYVPDWFPGAGWKRTAKGWRSIIQQVVDLPYEFVKQQMQAGTAILSFTSMHLEQGNLSPEKEHALKWTAQSIMGGGADTTVCAEYSFFLAMVLYPEVQKKAQEELDAVVGNDRLPMINDRSQLPYIDAIVKEVLRWSPVAPLGIPHRATEDGIHDGYFIPKGSIIFPNIWYAARCVVWSRTLLMCMQEIPNDEQTYKNPSEFRPERFLASEKQEPERDSRDFAFGFGRRTCPGLLLADTSLFITCAMVLSVFNIEKALDNGVPITPKAEFVDEIVNHPKVFNCSIKPRSEQAISVITSVEFVE